jgi:Tfp pilus assembly protein PilE
MSLIELMTVLTIAGVITAIALPSFLNAVKSYRLNADVSDLASMLNVARMRAAAEYAPYRLDIDTAAGTYVMEKLCGDTSSSGLSSDASCTGPYSAHSTPQYELGTQYASQGDTFQTCRPSVAGVFPGTITADASGCPSQLSIYFNTRSSPVDASGQPLSNGGAVLYATNPDNMAEAITVSPGGRVAIWIWNAANNQWTLR